ncbi:uncharacterized protein F4807DRAFT_150841 [Annulohypoxylon truncatum]|uniref:uncharacterized protein n=1 Tax=Annulohypoxylon truncatum TaxID=327061 RepID=UPI0020084607|nr:uncharacterized protein F4807DRAFT_150841 [Annulohypoxylon truncatum]KAI1208402.1 hypothetical protein F4807DRAFT_150841 [Annulohypoxylon truncatum]
METESHLNTSRPQSRSSSIPGNRACANCARVKCKCIYRTDDATCERCCRLKKQCVASISVGCRTAKRRQTSRTSRLEEKLDELVLRLEAQQRARSKGMINELDKPGEQDQSESNAESLPIASSTPATLTENLGGPTLICRGKTLESSSSYLDEPTPSEAEELLKRFREDTIGFFPFVYIPPHVTSQQLREAYPFLWLNIMCIAQASHKERLSLSDQARNIVVQKVVVNREKSLDLLLGLLALVGWSQRQRREKDKPFWTLFSQLIATLVCDLGLHMPQPENAPMFCGLGKDNDSRISNLFGTPTHDVQRAVLGAFFLTSRVSNIFKHAPGLRWSSHLDSCLSSLAQESTVSQDETLIALVKMQLIINQIHDESQTSGGGNLPALYLSALRSQLHEISRREKFTTAARNHPITSMFYHYTEVLISESAISKPLASWNEPDMRRFEVYQNCLVSIQAFLDAFFELPISLLESMPFTSYPQVVRVMNCLQRITTIQDPAWDRAAVRTSIDLLSTCDKMIAILEYLKASATLASRDGSEDQTHNWGLLVFRKLREAWQNDLDSMDAESTARREVPLPGGIFTSPMMFVGDPWFSDTWNGFWK